MKLRRMILNDFRCYSEISIDFDDMTTIVGRNDAGKSTLLEALAIFFGGSNIDPDDARIDGDKTNVVITCLFDELPESVVLDESEYTTLEDKYLTNSLGSIEIIKKFNCTSSKPKTAVFIRAKHPIQKKYDDLHSLNHTVLIKRAKDLGVDLKDVNQTANPPIRRAIWAHAEGLNLDDREIPADKLWEKISDYLPAFQLFKSDRVSSDQDSEAQDPLKAEIKRVLARDDIAKQLSDITRLVTESVQRIADATVQKISEMDSSLAKTLNPNISNKRWDSLFQVSITGDEGILLNKRGSGVRRLLLLNFFRANAERLQEEKGSGSIIYAIEEPETGQHPHNQRMLMSAFSEIIGTTDHQVIMTTHTPMLARTMNSRSIRFVHQIDDGERSIVAGGNDATNKLIAESLGVLPDHDVKLFIGVEGTHDISFLKGMSRLFIDAGIDVPSLEQLEISGEVIFLPIGGSNIAHWKSRLANLNIKELHIYDRDNQPPSAAKYQNYIDQINERSGCKGLLTSKREMENYIHYQAINDAYSRIGIALGFTNHFDDFADVPDNVAKLYQEISEKPTKMNNTKKLLNNLAISCMNYEQLREIDSDDEVLSWFREIERMLNADAPPLVSVSGKLGLGI